MSSNNFFLCVCGVKFYPHTHLASPQGSVAGLHVRWKSLMSKIEKTPYLDGGLKTGDGRTAEAKGRFCPMALKRCL